MSVAALVRPRTCSNWYPTQAAPGCATLSLPLSLPLLRLVPGDCRTGRPPIALSLDVQTRAGESLAIGVRFGSQSEVCVSVGNGGAERPDHYFDFCGRERAVAVTVYARRSDDDLEAIGSGNFTAADFSGRRRGAVVCPLRDPSGADVGECVFEYLAVRPFQGSYPLDDMESDSSSGEFCLSTAMHGEPLQPPMFSGHRGSGKTATAAVRENSIESFVQATRSGAVRSVELDVQLTKDHVPVVHHNWRRDNGEFVFNTPLSEVTVMPTLHEVCKALPSDVGFLVEVKYPPPNVAAELNIPYPDLNFIVEQTLDELLCHSSRENAERKMAVLSFDPDVCTMFKLKQSRIPVFLLHCETREPAADNADPRTMFIDRGIAFAHSQSFYGMVLLAEIILDDESLPRRIHAKGLKVLTYSDSNSVLETALYQLRELDVDGIIADGINRVARLVCENMAEGRECGNGKGAEVPS